MHHLTLKAAVTKYGPLHAEGKTADEVKAEIAKDEKQFSQEDVDAIYERIVEGSTDEPEEDLQVDDKKPVSSYIVVSKFHDIKDFSIVYNEGQEVNFNDERTQSLLSKGLITAVPNQ